VALGDALEPVRDLLELLDGCLTAAASVLTRTGLFVLSFSCTRMACWTSSAADGFFFVDSWLGCYSGAKNYA